MIRLISVVGHGTKLLPHFINHYTKYVDEINLALYVSPNHPNLFEEVEKIIQKYKNVKIVKTIKDKSFDWDRVTQLYNFIRLKHPNDWWVVADVDEFQLYPGNSLNGVIKRCDKNGWKIVRGGFIDRIGPNGELVDIFDQPTLWQQFPNAGFFRYPMSGACPNKICVVKGDVEITSGQHYAKINDHTTWRWQGWNHPFINSVDTIQVHHFKWDKTSPERIKSVADIGKEYSHSDEYKSMYSALRKHGFKIDLNHPNFMFEFNQTRPNYRKYKQWDKLIKNIISI